LGTIIPPETKNKTAKIKLIADKINKESKDVGPYTGNERVLNKDYDQASKTEKDTKKVFTDKVKSYL
jgi:hypothetical protein